MKSVLVTGGAGYIGSHTCLELLSCGYNVSIIDNFCNSCMEPLDKVCKLSRKQVKFYEGDVRNEKYLTQIFTENKFDAVIHFAGLKAVSESCDVPLRYYENNVFGTLVLCKVMKKFGVNHLIFSSSATVYGNNVPPYSEDMLVGTITNPYGRTKYFIEEILKDLSVSDPGFKVFVLRYFNPVGADESGVIGENPKGIPNNLMPYILKVAVGELPSLTVFGNDYDTPDGTCIRDYVHVSDLARGHISALEKMFEAEKKFEIYNLGTGIGCSVLEMIKSFEEAANLKLNYSFGARRAGDLPICYADVSKAEKQLGWKARYDIRRMCQDAWRWQKTNSKQR